MRFNFLTTHVFEGISNYMHSKNNVIIFYHFIDFFASKTNSPQSIPRIYEVDIPTALANFISDRKWDFYVGKMELIRYHPLFELKA